jgi:hypothetical protein
MLLSRRILHSLIFSQTRAVKKIKTHVLYSVTFSENRAVYEIMWKTYCRAGQAIDGNIMWRMRIAGPIRLVLTYLILILFHDKNGCAKSPQYFFIRKLPLFFTLKW